MYRLQSQTIHSHSQTSPFLRYVGCGLDLGWTMNFLKMLNIRAIPVFGLDVGLKAQIFSVRATWIFYSEKGVAKLQLLFVAGGGHDPSTSGLWIRRSNQLSYPAILMLILKWFSKPSAKVLLFFYSAKCFAVFLDLESKKVWIINKMTAECCINVFFTVLTCIIYRFQFC